jgi:hypothetical protein
MDFKYCILYIRDNTIITKLESSDNYSRDFNYYFMNLPQRYYYNKMINMLSIDGINKVDLTNYVHCFDLDITLLTSEYMELIHNIDRLKGNINECKTIEEIENEIRKFKNLEQQRADANNLKEIYITHKLNKTNRIIILLS